VPNIPSDVMENRDPALHQRMQLRPALAGDDITFIQDAVKAVDIVAKTVAFLPNERPGEERETLSYDYLVIAMSAHLAYDRIPGFAEYGHTVSDLFHGERLRQYLYEDGYNKGGPVVIGAAHFHQGDSAEGLQPYPGGCQYSLPEGRMRGPHLGDDDLDGELVQTHRQWHARQDHCLYPG